MGQIEHVGRGGAPERSRHEVATRREMGCAGKAIDNEPRSCTLEEYRETFWSFLFDASHVGFAHARRWVPLTSGLAGAALWNDSPEAAALRHAPWTVAAWVAPVLPKNGPGVDR